MNEFPIHPLQAMINGFAAAGREERSKNQMTLGGLIKALESVDPERKIVGLGRPMSYRGYYSDLAFEPSQEPRAVREVLETAKGCMGKVFEGYKGGDYEMGETTPLWSAEYGCGYSPRIMGLNLSADPISLNLELEEMS